ncbi:MAG TPA: hypothetical protein VF491_21870 [Vicinamibacterales bacterium]|jgi:hypothetical protein
MFDTVVFNRILDGVIPAATLVGRVTAFATHIQRDEINNTRNPVRRVELLQVFQDVIHSQVATGSFVLDVSRLDEARLSGGPIVPTASAVYGVSEYGGACYSDGSLYDALKAKLDALNDGKPNNVQDVLIAETAIIEGHVLITDDVHLAAVTRGSGGQCQTVDELLAYLT